MRFQLMGLIAIGDTKNIERSKRLKQILGNYYVSENSQGHLFSDVIKAAFASSCNYAILPAYVVHRMEPQLMSDEGPYIFDFQDSGGSIRVIGLGYLTLKDRPFSLRLINSEEQYDLEFFRSFWTIILDKLKIEIQDNPVKPRIAFPLSLLFPVEDRLSDLRAAGFELAISEWAENKAAR